MKVFVSTPRGVVVKTDRGTVELRWNAQIQRFNGQYDKAQEWLDSEVLKDSTRYTPILSGVLRASGELGTRPGSGEVVWVVPYARFQYYGKVMVYPPTGSTYAPKAARKKTIDKDLTYSDAGARAFWFEAAKKQNKRKWLDGVRRMAGGQK